MWSFEILLVVDFQGSLELGHDPARRGGTDHDDPELVDGQERIRHGNPMTE